MRPVGCLWLVLPHLASEPRAGWHSGSGRHRGGHHRSHPASTVSCTHRSLCQLRLGWGCCWLAHGEHHVTPLWHR